MIFVREGDGGFQVCVDIISGSIDLGVTETIGYTLQDAASKNLYLCIKVDNWYLHVYKLPML